MTREWRFVQTAPAAAPEMVRRGPFYLHQRTVNLLETTQNEVTCILRNAGLE
jgi:uncharacterized protein (UPF0261 family)